MQEICRSEFDRWHNEWGWWGVFTPMTTWGENDGNACIGRDKGQAILARPTVVMTNEQKLVLSGDGSGKDFRLTCVDVAGIVSGASQPLKVCTTHLSATDSTARDQQLNEAKAWLHNFSNDDNVAAVFTGDLNMIPTTPVLDSLYTRYKEVAFPERGRPVDRLELDDRRNQEVGLHLRGPAELQRGGHLLGQPARGRAPNHKRDDQLLT
ncbi:endonuclease/exonuclease/phosphatase family protein [Nocardioides sp. B-3]|uniref:endonuclease/exonuclease/phosphatase family protein n=1 Tax=Nocardioides sp. B-3 TaxID=2895565 RepID=UPI0021537358|nr:hypothetical protein [Nocardioides sp. B-3]UUZ58653.1 hypothetical protein LP418_21405 [Nocardioides sp. B-3]